MANNYDFIIDNMKFSHSSLTAFHTCKYMFYLTYIMKEDREQGFFSDFGNLIHEIFQKYFSMELELWDLKKYYEDNYSRVVTTDPPPFPKSMGESYYNAGLDFFGNMSFKRENYEIISIEDSFESKFNDKITLIIKPDLVLRNKKNGNIILLDYKTYKLKHTKKDDEKLESYKRQMHLYSHFLWKEKSIEINKIFLWFVRNNEFLEIDMNPMEIQATLDWVENTIRDIKQENVWLANNIKDNAFFCSQICGLRSHCEYKIT